MSSDERLRNHHRKLLLQLKKSQEQISKLIIASKHSDHRVLSEPLASTVLGVDGSNPLEQSTKLLAKANQSLKKKTIKCEIPKFAASSPQKSNRSSSKGAKQILRDDSNKMIANDKSSTVATDDKLPVQRMLLNDKSSFPKEQKLLECSDNMRPYECETRPTKSILKTADSSKSMVIVHKEATASSVTSNESYDIFAAGDHADLPIGRDKSGTSAADDKQAPKKTTDSRPLLGYDWIAGVMDNQQQQQTTVPSSSVATEMSEEALAELCEFRRAHRHECHSGVGHGWSELMRTPKTPKTPVDMLPKTDYPKAKSPDPGNIYDPRIVNYTINKRLFPISLVDEQQQRSGTDKSPRYVRVTIPKMALASPHQYKPKRKGAYCGGADSLALPDHCVQGWQQTARRGNKMSKKNARRRKHGDDDTSELDLRSSIKPRDRLTELQLNAGQFDAAGASSWCAEEERKRSELHVSSEDVLRQSYAVQLAHHKLRSDCKYY